MKIDRLIGILSILLQEEKLSNEEMVKDYVCPDGCVCFRMTVEKTPAENFYKGKYYKE